MLGRKREHLPPPDSKLASLIYLWHNLGEALLLGGASRAGKHLRRRWRFWLTVVLFLVVYAWTGSAVVGALIPAAYLALRLWKHPQSGKGWWEHRSLSAAFVEARILQGGDQLPTLSYRGKVIHTDHGTTAVVALPGGTPIREVLTRLDRLAAAMRVPENRLEVWNTDGDPANVVRIHVAKNAPKQGTPSPVADSGPTSWSTPVRVGVDARGNVVTFDTDEANTLIAGRPGAGKTSLARILLAHYLLDVAALIYLLDGKGSVRDYGACRPLCERFVSGTDDHAVTDTLAMLNDVLALVRARNSEHTSGDPFPGVLVLLEEFQDVRSAATPDQRRDLDNTLGRIVRMGRAVAVHVIVSTQRPTVDDLPSGTRNLLSQRGALMLRNAADVALVLGTTPGVALPTRRGQMLYTDGGPVVAVELDRLTDEAWARVCKHATAGRGGRGPDRPALRVVTDPTPVVLEEVLALLAAAPKGLTPTDLHNQLSDEARTEVPTARELGLLLAKYPQHVERVWLGKAKVWRLRAPVAARSC